MTREEIGRLLAAIELLQEFVEDANGITFGAYTSWCSILQEIHTFLVDLLKEKELKCQNPQ